MSSAQGVLVVFALAFSVTAAACGGSVASAPSPGNSAANSTAQTSSGAVASNGAERVRDVRAIHRSRCGNCHVRVEPGTRTKAQLENAFQRHHTRVKMNDAEWAAMVDYLASDATRTQVSSISTEK